jgi:hypothetical protein
LPPMNTPVCRMQRLPAEYFRSYALTVVGGNVREERSLLDRDNNHCDP